MNPPSLSIYLSIYLFIYLSMYLSIYLSIYPSRYGWMDGWMHICWGQTRINTSEPSISIYQWIYLSIGLIQNLEAACTYLSIYPSIHLGMDGWMDAYMLRTNTHKHEWTLYLYLSMNLSIYPVNPKLGGCMYVCIYLSIYPSRYGWMDGWMHICWGQTGINTGEPSFSIYPSIYLPI